MMDDLSDGDDVPTLSLHTIKALQEFYQEQEEREQQELKSSINNGDQQQSNEIVFKEDWQLSQFWYDAATVETLVKVAKKVIGEKGKVALISCPTLYKQMKQECTEDNEVMLFEFDKRFAVFGQDFHLYDYKKPLDVPRNLASHYDLVIADPPFLSEECLTKTAVTVKFLSKGNIILCTGAVMADLAQRLLDLKKSIFEPHHQNNLANEFWCFTNFDFDATLKDS